MSKFDTELDASGLNCPVPILMLKKSVAGMEAGQIIKVLATDPNCVIDFTAFCKQTGHKMLSSDKENGKFLFMIEITS